MKTISNYTILDEIRRTQVRLEYMVKNIENENKFNKTIPEEEALLEVLCAASYLSDILQKYSK